MPKSDFEKYYTEELESVDGPYKDLSAEYKQEMKKTTAFKIFKIGNALINATVGINNSFKKAR